MTDLNKEREAFEALQNPLIFERIVYINAANLYTVKNDFQNDMFTLSKCNELNFGWSMWQKAKAQAVPEGYVVVPKVPTQAMLEAGSDANECGAWPSEIFTAMVEASESGAEG